MTPFAVELGGGTTISARRFPVVGPAPALVVLAHGAGAGQESPFMVASARGLAARGLEAVTFNFPYMERGAKVPNPAPQLESCFRAVVEALGRDGALTGRALVIGGKSMGGRMATHLAARPDATRPPIAGVVLLGYPLHPPGNPAKARTAHLPAITAPVLFVQGTRDSFGSPDELAPVIATMAAAVTLHRVEGGDHSFKVTGLARGAQPGVLDGILDVVAGWVRRL